MITYPENPLYPSIGLKEELGEEIPYFIWDLHNTSRKPERPITDKSISALYYLEQGLIEAKDILTEDKKKLIWAGLYNAITDEITERGQAFLGLLEICREEYLKPQESNYHKHYPIEEIIVGKYVLEFQNQNYRKRRQKQKTAKTKKTQTSSKAPTMTEEELILYIKEREETRTTRIEYSKYPYSICY